MSDWYVSSAAWSAIAQFATGAYSVGQIVRPLTAPAFQSQYAFRCTTAGNATVEPTWTSAGNNNNTVTATGGAVFTNVSGQSAYGWSAAAGNLYSMGFNGGGGTTRFATGDRVYLSSDHAETTTNTTYAPGTASGFGLLQYISVNRAGSVPPVAADQVSGAAITINNANAALDSSCNIYWQGMTIATSGNLTINPSASLKSHYFRNCAIQLTGASNQHIMSGAGGSVTFDNTTVSFNNSAQFIGNNYPIEFTWINTPSAVLGAAVPGNLFVPITNTGGMFPVVCRGVDLSAVTTALAYALAANGIKLLLDSCRIASGVTRYGTPNNTSTPVDVVELVNCYDGTNIISERHTPAGDLTTNRSTTLVGGAQDDVGLFAHQMASSSRADMLAVTLDSFWMDVEQSAVGASHTATVEIVSSASLNTTDISLQLEYLGTSGSSRASFISSLPSALTASAALPTSTATWNSPPATPVYQHIQVSFTPQQAGRLRGIVRLGKASTTVYVNPQVTVT